MKKKNKDINKEDFKVDVKNKDGFLEPLKKVIKRKGKSKETKKN